jgi:hypothetical protein
MDRRVVIFGAIFACACDPGGWKSLDTGTTSTLRGVFVEAPNRIWMTGDDGTVLFYDGERFSNTSTDTGRDFDVPNFYGVVASAGETAIAGDDGLVLTRREALWDFDGSRTTARMLTMFRPSPSLFYAAGERGRVIRRRVGETSWEPVDINASGSSKITGGWAISENTIAVTTDLGQVIELVDGQWVSAIAGGTQTSTSVVPLFGVWSSTRGADLVAVGLGGSVFRRAEGAGTLDPEDSTTDADLYAIYGGARDRVFAVGSSGTILEYDGSAWDSVPSASSKNLFAIHGLADGSVMVAVGDKGTAVILEE